MTVLPTPAYDDTPLQMMSPTCPLCHTVETTITEESLKAGGYWTCAMCHQIWNTRRLETVAAYARYVAAE